MPSTRRAAHPTQQELKEIFDYDPEGFLVWRKPKPGKAKPGQRAGSRANKDWYASISLNRVTWAAHRLIFIWHHGFLPPEVDHINRDKADNRIENLRAATRVSNGANRSLNSNSTTGHRNISYDPVRRKWCVAIKAGSTVLSKRFSSLDEAVAAAQTFRKLLFGDFS
jgi:hypothetical protein